ncbi:hypothetical protein XFF6166_780010 [Xanthomonas citri pv. fuscans]|uniref:Uncharacterized protein n=1 Tax=Xanthomonas campestris pv. phaseoli TaxID=317013 RepID=A0AB38DWN7_XANCH|nr:hypothetical protein XAP412_20012 [Xanthomonas phaseoli pv. phaseoli]SON86439.1 hypothetical protein XFF6166_780010 [Xanthomonas citri pv. fuscans]SON84696.1 hypothetical protein XAP7430_20012 [Xanthomonas phaseoli pv. phaseoli]SON95577.1 hypothetical protein XFF6990_210017 [Xanthomonas citri pv. fuscans]SOO01564.1 hypothetical protein XFF6960_490009 [Xanthomonas citri pv. fuscans]
MQGDGQVEAEAFAVLLAIDAAGHQGGGLKQKFFHEVLHKHSPAESGSLCIAVNRFHLLRGHVRDNLSPSGFCRHSYLLRWVVGKALGVYRYCTRWFTVTGHRATAPSLC